MYIYTHAHMLSPFLSLSLSHAHAYTQTHIHIHICTYIRMHTRFHPFSRSVSPTRPHLPFLHTLTCTHDLRCKQKNMVDETGSSCNKPRSTATTAAAVGPLCGAATTTATPTVQSQAPTPATRGPGFTGLCPQCVAACSSVLQYVAVCCSVLQRLAACCSVLQCLQCVAVR